MMKVETSGGKMMFMGLLTIVLCFAVAIMAWAAIPQQGIPCSEACPRRAGGRRAQDRVPRPPRLY